MSTSRHINKICAVVTVISLLLTVLFMNGTALGLVMADRVMGYENKLFDTSFVHTLDIVMNDWDGFIDTCENEEYSSCSVVIDGEAFKNIGIRAKGNTSLSSVKSLGSERYSFKVEFDHYENGKSYYGLDKLSLNNLIQDHTMMKDYLVYMMMGDFGADAPLCSFVYITVNGEDWGLYLAVEGVEDSFLQRNYGSDTGELYKPDSMSNGGGRGNGKDFDFNNFDFGDSDSGNSDFNNSDYGNPDFGDSDFDNKDFNNSEFGKHNFGNSDFGNYNFKDFNFGNSDFGDTDRTFGGRGGSDNSDFGNDLPQLPSGEDFQNVVFSELPEMSDGGIPQMPGGNMPEMPEGGMPQMPEGDFSQDPQFGQGGGLPNLPDGSTSQVPPNNSDENVSGESSDGVPPTPPDGGNTQVHDNINGEANGNSASENEGESNRGFGRGENGFGGGMNGGFGGGNMGGGMGSDDVKLKYIDDDPDSYSNIFDNAKTDVSEADKERLVASLKSLSEYSDLENILDTDEVIRYFVVHNFVRNGDSYTGSMIHNYYLHEKDGKLSMIPWDYNLAFGTFQGGNASSEVNASIDSPVSSGTVDDRPMVGWIFSDESYTEEYHRLFSEFIDRWFTNGELVSLIKDTSELIRPYVEKDPTKFCTLEEFDAGIEAITQFVTLRAEAVSRQLLSDSSAVDTSGLNLSDMGSMNDTMGNKGNMGGFGNKNNGGFGDRNNGGFGGEDSENSKGFGDNPPDEASGNEESINPPQFDGAADNGENADSENNNSGNMRPGEMFPRENSGNAGGNGSGYTAILTGVSAAALFAGILIAVKIKH